ncbi:conserved hypothetical protein [Hahella chejuensis KCTC 2396]|uniref:Uncharacterized protein n=1 Tax=Hahella chejuensis (strain KCTC 2396) TaxID=349521 RepID=Q2SE18_HAHCH|nr:hypothetical protein [Hahella chejuensis]ABC31106.1 conserved hypothetical protein [Hahella chejuensis KCTC 2396]
MSGKSDAIDAKAESQSGNVDDLAGACPLQKALEDKHTLDLLCELQNSQPAAGLPYKVTVVTDGSVHTGVLGSDGAAKLSDLPASEVEAEFGEAPDEAAISAARGQIASALEEILKEEKEEAAKRDEEFSKLNILQKKTDLENRVAKGIFDAGVGMLEFLDNVLELASPTEVLNRAIKTSWESYNTETDDWKSDFIKNFDKSNHDALVKALGFDPNMVTPELIAEAQEIASFIYEDEETQTILASFAKEFATSQHITELAEFAGGGAFEIVLAALLASATGGVGAAGMAVSKARLMPKLAKLGELLRNLAKQLKKKYRFIKKKGSTNGSVEAKLNKPASVEAPSISEVTDGETVAEVSGVEPSSDLIYGSGSGGSNKLGEPPQNKVTTKDFELLHKKGKDTSELESVVVSKEDLIIKEMGDPRDIEVKIDDKNVLGNIAVYDHGPEFVIENITDDEKVIRLKDSESITDFFLELGIDKYKSIMGVDVDPPNMNGSLMSKNSDNFKREYIAIKLNNSEGFLDEGEAMREAIKKMSFGRARERLGYSEFDFEVFKKEDVYIKMKDGSVEVVEDVPSKFRIISKKPQ